MANATCLAALLNALRDMRTSEHVTSLLLLSDGEFGDLPPDSAAVARAFRQAGVDKIFLLVPFPGSKVDDRWTQICSQPPILFDGMASDETALAFGVVVAATTGQQLLSRRPD